MNDKVFLTEAQKNCIDCAIEKALAEKFSGALDDELNIRVLSILAGEKSADIQRKILINLSNLKKILADNIALIETLTEYIKKINETMATKDDLNELRKEIKENNYNVGKQIVDELIKRGVISIPF